MKILTLIAIFIFSINIQASFDDDSLREEIKMIQLINTHRESLGLEPLTLLFEAREESKHHSRYMADTLRGLTHDGFSERIDNIEASININISRSAENVAYNSSTKRAHEALLASPGHRRNIEGDYTHLGVGIETDENERMYFTQILVKLKPTQSK